MRKTKQITDMEYKKLACYVLRVLYMPHVLAFLISKNKGKISDDIRFMNHKLNINYSETLSLTYHLYVNKYYRNIFYKRTGKTIRLFSFLLPSAKDFFPCDNMEGGVYPAHPYATILNAKKIGKNFSFRQCTTLGNKKDGSVELPVIGDNVSLGANVVIIGDITIGNNVVVGAGSVVVKSIPDNAIAVGNPAKVIKYNE